ncbi:MAG: type II secretion system minor pseudopilin GspK [Thermodesulfovibrionales bacterium]
MTKRICHSRKRSAPACPVGRSGILPEERFPTSRNDKQTGLSLSPFTDRSGMALVLVLMIVALITAMVVEFAYGVYVNTNALHNWQTSQKLSITAKSATRLASKLITSNMLEQYKTRAAFEMSQKIPFGDLDGTITLRIEDENAKFNLNSLRNPEGQAFFVNLIRNLNRVRNLNLDPDIANKVTYWINASTDRRPQNAASIQPKNALLDSVDELLLIPGIDRESYDKLLPYVTIYGSGDNNFSINVNTADVPVLMSLAENTSEDMAERIISYRPLTSLQAVPDISVGFGAGHAVYSGTAFHVVATAESGGIKRIIESVLQGNSVLYWKEM